MSGEQVHAEDDLGDLENKGNRRCLAKIRKITWKSRATHNIQNTVGDHLGVDTELVATLGQGEDDRVTGPEDNDHRGGNVVNLPDIGGLQSSSLSPSYDEVVQDDKVKL